MTRKRVNKNRPIRGGEFNPEPNVPGNATSTAAKQPRMADAHVSNSAIRQPTNNNSMQRETIYIPVPNSLLELVPDVIPVLSVEDVESILGPFPCEEIVRPSTLPVLAPNIADNIFTGNADNTPHQNNGLSSNSAQQTVNPSFVNNTPGTSNGFHAPFHRVYARGERNNGNNRIQEAAAEPPQVEPIRIRGDINLGNRTQPNSTSRRRRPAAPTDKMFESRY